KILDRLDAILVRLDRDAALVLVITPERDRTGNLGDDRGVLRLARLEQFRHARQTTRDVASLGAFRRDTGDDVAGLHHAARIYRNDGIRRQKIAGLTALLQLRDLLLAGHDHYRRLQIRGPGRRAPIQNNALGDAGRLVGRLRDGGAFHEILELDGAVHFRDD